MKKMLLLGGIVAALATNTSAQVVEDLSSIQIFATTYSTRTTAQIMVTAPSGRRTGLQGGRDTLREEIPGAGFFVESIGDDVTGEPGQEEIKWFLRPANSGEYTITIFGLQNSSYTLEIETTDRDNLFRGKEAFDGLLQAGSTNTLLVNFDPTPGSTTAILRVVTFESLRRDLQTAAHLDLLGDLKFFAKLDKILAEGEKALSKKGGKEKDRENRKEAVAKLREFIKKLEKAFKGEKDDEHDDDAGRPSKRFVGEFAFKALKADAEALIAALGGRPGKDGDDD